MKRLLAHRGTHAAAVGVAVLLAAGGGYAIAAGGGTITACVTKGTHNLYLAPCHKHDRKLTWNQVGRQGSQGNPGTPGAPGIPGTAKAYGLILQDGTFDTARSKNVTSSSTPSTGEYCVTVSGATPQNAGAVATPDYSNDSTVSSKMAHVEWRSSSNGCPAGQFDFRTYEVTANAGGLLVTLTPEGFFFAIP